MQYMTHSVWKSKKNTCQTGQSVVAYLMFRTFLFCHTMAPRGNVRNKMRLLGQAVKTSPFHGGNTGSIPVGVIKWAFVLILSRCGSIGRAADL